jgi:hypothetical protein
MFLYDPFFVLSLNRFLSVPYVISTDTFYYLWTCEFIFLCRYDYSKLETSHVTLIYFKIVNHKLSI